MQKKKTKTKKKLTSKKYTPNDKEKYMCIKHKKFFTEKLLEWRKEIIKSNNESAALSNLMIIVHQQILLIKHLLTQKRLWR